MAVNTELSSKQQQQIFKEKTGVTFDVFYLKYHSKIVFYINRFTKNEAAAEDLAAETFEQSLRKIYLYDNTKSQFSTWLWTIAKNNALRYLDKNRQYISLEHRIDDDGTVLKDFMEYEDDSEDNDHNELIDKKASIIKKEIKHLKEPYKTILQMRELEHKTYKQISIEMGEWDEIEITFTEDDIIFNDLERHPWVELPEDWVKVLDFKTEGSFLKIVPGTYNLKVFVALNLSTLKSRIRNGRELLRRNVEQIFRELEDLHHGNV